MKHYTVGFMFSEDRQKVALIKKNRPDWQAGKHNGIGGKVEEGESAYQCMVREFYEETGYQQDDWDFVFKLEGSDYQVDFFRSFGDLSQLKTMTDEEVVVDDVRTFLNFTDTVIPNLLWIIRMCLDDSLLFGFEIKEKI